MVASDIVRGVTSGNSGSSTAASTSIDVTAPAGTANGDQLLVIITLRTLVAIPPWRSVDPGWTLVANENTGTGVAFFYRAKYGTDVTGSTWTFDGGAGNATANKSAWACIGLTVGDYLTGATQIRPASSLSTPTPSITTGESAYLVALAGDRAAGSTWTWPAGWAEQVDTQSTGTNAVSATIAVDDTTPEAAGTYSVTPTAVGTATGNGWAGIFAYAVGFATLSSTLTATASATASVGPSVSHSGAVVATATASATVGRLITKAGALNASATTSSSVSGTRTQLKAVSASAAATAAVAAGTPIKTSSLVATAAATVAITGIATRIAALVASATASASVSGTRTQLKTVSASAAATAAVLVANTVRLAALQAFAQAFATVLGSQDRFDHRAVQVALLVDLITVTLMAQSHPTVAALGSASRPTEAVLTKSSMDAALAPQ